MLNETTILMTTINPPSQRLLAWLELSTRVVVVGDRKTPSQAWQKFAHENPAVVYLSPEDQESLFPDLSAEVGWGTYARKNLGYAYLYSRGVDKILETDDDTFPRSRLLGAISKLENSSAQLLEIVKEQNDSGDFESRWWNPYAYFAPGSGIWPRGYPLEEIKNNWSFAVQVGTQSSKPRHVQFLVNREPDLDAIFRLTKEQIDFSFEENDDLVVVHPFRAPANTQATWTDGLREWLYFPQTCSLRVADILRSYWIQCHVGLVYGGFLAEQDRNPHNYLDDLRLEVALYTHADRIFDVIEAAAPGGLEEILLSLVNEGILNCRELEIYKVFRSSLGASE